MQAIRASGSAAVAAAVALPLRPLIERERVPKPVPARKPTPVRKPASERNAGKSILGRVGAFALSLPDHRLLDRVVRGRAWIPLLGVLLAGIVAAQVEILKLSASMGRSLEQTTSLTTQNEQLRANVAALSDDQRIEHIATNMGMVLPPPGAVGYLAAPHGGGVGAALANIHTPDTATFLALSPTNGALVTGPGTSMLPTSSGVLQQAGTPGSATPTTTPSATSTVPSSSATAASGTATTTGTTTSAAPAEQPPPTTDQQSSTTTGSQTATQTTPTDAQTTPTDTQTPTQTTSSQTPATGAAAIQPATSNQQSTGG